MREQGDSIAKRFILLHDNAAYMAVLMARMDCLGVGDITQAMHFSAAALELEKLGYSSKNQDREVNSQELAALMLWLSHRDKFVYNIQEQQIVDEHDFSDCL